MTDVAQWMAQQRWYAAKGGVPDLRTIAEIDETTDEARVPTRFVIDDAATGAVLYQVPVTEHREPVPELEPARIDPEGTQYDGPHDPAYARWLLGRIDAGEESLRTDRHRHERPRAARRTVQHLDHLRDRGQRHASSSRCSASCTTATTRTSRPSRRSPPQGRPGATRVRCAARRLARHRTRRRHRQRPPGLRPGVPARARRRLARRPATTLAAASRSRTEPTGSAPRSPRSTSHSRARCRPCPPTPGAGRAGAVETMRSASTPPPPRSRRSPSTPKPSAPSTSAPQPSTGPTCSASTATCTSARCSRHRSRAAGSSSTSRASPCARSRALAPRRAPARRRRHAAVVRLRRRALAHDDDPVDAADWAREARAAFLDGYTARDRRRRPRPPRGARRVRGRQGRLRGGLRSAQPADLGRHPGGRGGAPGGAS